MSWLITCPTWGARCVEAFVSFGLPSILAALEHSGSQARFVIHTDKAPRPLVESTLQLDVTFRPLPRGATPHHQQGLAHREAAAMAESGENIAFLCSDIVLSVECFAAAEKRFAEGKRLIMGAATRTHGAEPPIGAASRALLAWTMAHRHPSIVENFYGQGKSAVPWAVFFQNGENIVLRAFHLHPFACVKDRDIKFAGATIDAGLADAFERDEIHVVTDADEMSLAEMSPLSRSFPTHSRPMTPGTIAEWAARQALDVHRWFFRDHAIQIAGEGGCSEQPICEEVIRKTLAIISNPRSGAAQEQQRRRMR